MSSFRYHGAQTHDFCSLNTKQVITENQTICTMPFLLATFVREWWTNTLLWSYIRRCTRSQWMHSQWHIHSGCVHSGCVHGGCVHGGHINSYQCHCIQHAKLGSTDISYIGTPWSMFAMLFVSAGFNSVFPMEKLFPFSPSELQLILCGDQAPQWTRNDILQYTEPKLGYTKER